MLDPLAPAARTGHGAWALRVMTQALHAGGRMVHEQRGDQPREPRTQQPTVRDAGARPLTRRIDCTEEPGERRVAEAASRAAGPRRDDGGARRARREGQT